MAKRVPVVVSQSQFSDASRRNLEEELVAMLLLEDNVEVTVIPHLQTLEDGSTGLLCLEGLNGDLILCTWEPAGATIQQLLDLGQPAAQGRTSFTKDDELTGDGGRRLVYPIDLSEQRSVDEIRGEIRRIRDEAQTQIFNIVGMSLPIAPASPPAEPATDAIDQPADSPTMDPTATDVVAEEADDEKDINDKVANSEDINEDDNDQLDRQLDQLLDDFDAMDI